MMCRALKNDSYCIPVKPFQKQPNKKNTHDPVTRTSSNKRLKAFFYYKCTDKSHTLHESCPVIHFNQETIYVLSFTGFV